jgi:hypothetical protein
MPIAPPFSPVTPPSGRCPPALHDRQRERQTHRRSSRPCRSAGWASTVTRHIDTSDQVYFGNDQIGVGFIEEIDFDYLATDATAVLLTAVS